MKERRKAASVSSGLQTLENHEDAGFGEAFVPTALLDLPQRRSDSPYRPSLLLAQNDL